MGAKAKLRAIPAPEPGRVRCAIYTRKSTDEGLEQDFNTLEAQREAGEAFVQSQRHEGWVMLPERYDDGGYTGADMDRPALKRLLADIETERVNCIVVYKVDRLTRSIHDFFKILEILERHNVTFVSVTQQFNSTTSLGRLTLNMLLSFAQFERETIAERTRDKMRAARRKGKFIGGNLVLGYDLAPKRGALIVNAEEAVQVHRIFRLYLELGSLIPVVEELERRGVRMKRWTTREGRTRGGAFFNKTTLHNLLTNVIYTGRVKFDSKLFEGEHERIIDDATFNRVQEQLQRNGRRGGRSVRNKCGGLLKGLVRCGSCGAAMTHTYSRKKKTLYRYYVSITAHQPGSKSCETKPVPAGLDWDMWLGQTPKVDYVPERCHAMFRYWWEYSGSTLTDWGAHHNDIALWGMGMDHTGPITISGKPGVEMIPGGYTAYSEYHIEYTYANGIRHHCITTMDDTGFGATVRKGPGTLHNGVRFDGTEGWVWVTRGELRASKPDILQEPFSSSDTRLYASNNHKGNFFDSIRSRKTPAAPAEIGHRSISVCHLGVISMRLGRSLNWDPEKQQFVNDAEADKWLSRPQREPYTYEMVL